MAIRRILLAALLPLAVGLCWVAWQFDPPIWDFALSADGKRLFAICGGWNSQQGEISDTSLHVWDIEAERRIATMAITPKADSWKFSSNGNTLAVVTNLDSHYRVYDTATLSTISDWHDAKVTNSTGSLIVACDTNVVIANIRWNRGSAIESWNIRTNKKTQVELSPIVVRISAGDTNRLLVGLDTPKNLWIKVYDMTGDELTLIADMAGITGDYIQLTPDGKRFLRKNGATIEIYDLATKNLQTSIETSSNPARLYDVQFTPDGQFVAAADGFFDTWYIWSASTGQLMSRVRLPKVRTHFPIGRNIKFASDGKTLIRAGYEGQFEFFDWTTGKLLRRFPDRQIAVAVLAGGAVLWSILWIAWGRQYKPLPWFDVLVINGLIIGPLFVHILRSSPRFLIASAPASFNLANIASLTALLILWWIHGHIRWSMRLAGGVVGLAILCALILVIRQQGRAGWDILVGSVTYIGLLGALLVLQRRLGYRIGRTDETRAELQGSRQTFQWPLRDTFLVITATAVLLAVLRFVKPQAISSEGATFVLTNGASLAIAAFVASWAALGTMHWLPRLGLLLTAVPAISLALTSTFQGFPIFPWWWYMNQHVMCATMVFITLLIFRLSGWGLRRAGKPAPGVV